MTATRQQGSILGKFALVVAILAVLLAVGGVLYLGSTSLPPPSSEARITIDDAQVTRR